MGNETSVHGQYGKKIKNNIVIKWTKGAKECPFPPRDGQSAAVIGSKLYIFGGVLFSKDVEDSEGQDAETNDLLVFDCSSDEWSKEVCQSDLPPPRSGSCLAAVGTSLYLFGGLSQLCGWMNDFHMYDTVSKLWHKLDYKNPPHPRDKLHAVSVDQKVFVFGGFGPAIDVDNPDDILLENESDEEYEDIDEGLQEIGSQAAANFTWSNQLFVFNTVDNSWSFIHPVGKKCPSARAAHSLDHIKDKHGVDWLYVFGGKDCESRQNDLWSFNLSTNTWTMCESKGCQPQPRSFHASAAIGNRLVINGGRGLANQHFNDFNIYDTTTKEWLQPEFADSNMTPPTLGLHTLRLVENELILFGGSSELDPATGTCAKFYRHLYKVLSDDVLTGGAQHEQDQSSQDPQEVPALLNLQSKTERFTEANT